MQRWEYAYVLRLAGLAVKTEIGLPGADPERISKEAKIEHTHEALLRLGNDGWELCAAESSGGGTVFWLKRPIAN